MRFLTRAEVEDLADTINPSYRAFVLVGAYCGLRLGEMAGLRWSDVDMLQRRITVENQLGADEPQLAPLKTTASYRTIVMPRFVADALGVHARFGATQSPSERGAFVFASPEGTPLQVHNFRHRVWQPAVRKAGFSGLRMHDLRHTCASLAIAAGADVKVLQDMLGHASAAMTLDQYGKLLPGRSEQVADRLDALYRGSA
jgi:integrase